MQFIKNNQNFNIDKPYFCFKEFDSNKAYNIYVDGSYSRIGRKSFCCVGGVILECNTLEKIGEFFAPVPALDTLNQHVIPNFEKIAIDTALLIKNNYNLNVKNIFNDSSTEVAKYPKNNHIQWISRKDNIADDIVSYCRNIWKEKNSNYQKNIQFRNSLFSHYYEKNIFIIQYSKPKSCLYYFFAMNEQGEIIEHVKFNKLNNLGSIELIKKILKNNIEHVNFNIAQHQLDRLKRYAKGDSIHCGEIQEYEDFFNLSEQENLKFSLSYSQHGIYPKKKIVVNYLNTKTLENNID